MDSPILIWNAYAVSFNPNDQIRICSNPIYETALQNFERLSFYFDSFWDFTDIVRPYLSHPPQPVLVPDYLVNERFLSFRVE